MANESSSDLPAVLLYLRLATTVWRRLRLLPRARQHASVQHYILSVPRVVPNQGPASVAMPAKPTIEVSTAFVKNAHVVRCLECPPLTHANAPKREGPPGYR